MKRILLEITGTQTVDNQKDELVLTTMGTLRDNGAAYIITYKEEQEPPLSPVNVTVHVQKDESTVQITRTGGSEGCLIIEKAKRHQTPYGTEFGDLLLGICGKEISVKADTDGGLFTFAYDIDINGAVTSQNKIKMDFSIKQ